MFARLGSFVSRRWWLVILAWLVLIVGLRWLAPDWDAVTLDGDLAYLPSRMPSVRGEARLKQAFPENRAKSQIAFVLEREDGLLTDADLAAARRLGDVFRARKEQLRLVSVWIPDEEDEQSKYIAPKLTSDDGQAALVVLFVENEFMATDNIRVARRVYEQLDAFRRDAEFPRGLRVSVTGSAAVGGDMLDSARESIEHTEVATVILVLCILLVVYRAPLLVLVPAVSIGVSVVVATSLVALLADTAAATTWLDFKIFKTTKIFIVVILFGAGTDYCLFLIARYKEELGRGLDRAAALTRALARVGDAILASALTTIVGLGVMVFSDFGKFRNSGPAIALCLLVALVACTTLAPAMMRAAGGWLFWPLGHRLRGEAIEGGPIPTAGWWNTVARWTLARPGFVLVACVALLAPPAGWGIYCEAEDLLADFSRHVSYDLLNELREDRPSVQGARALLRHFAPGEAGPLTIVVGRERGGLETDEGSADIEELTEFFYQFDGVTSVRSRTSPLGDPPRKRFGLLSGIKRTAGEERAQQAYVSQAPGLVGKVTRFDLILQHEPFSKQSARLLEEIDTHLTVLSNQRDSAWYGAEFDYAGTTAGIRDLHAVTRSDRTLIKVLVLLAVFAVLLLILRRPWICAFLIVSVVFSYYVAIGTTEVVFAWLYGDSYDGLDWKVPIFLFVLLVAIGEDYNIYLVTRVFEEQKRHGLRDGLHRAVVQTGGIITSCGVIMAGTFLSMMTGTLRAMMELGFALSLGVLLDTLIVRPILVPAFLACFQREAAGDASTRRPALTDSREGDATSHVPNAHHAGRDSTQAVRP